MCGCRHRKTVRGMGGGGDVLLREERRVGGWNGREGGEGGGGGLVGDRPGSLLCPTLAR